MGVLPILAKSVGQAGSGSSVFERNKYNGSPDAGHARKAGILAECFDPILRNNSGSNDSPLPVFIRVLRVLVEFFGLQFNTPASANGNDSKDAARELEGGTAGSNPVVLPSNSDVRGEAQKDGFFGNKRTRRRTRENSQSAAIAKAGSIAMPTEIIERDHFLRAKYQVPKSRIIEFDIKADEPLKTYVMRPQDIDGFLKGEPFRYFGGFQDPPKKHHNQELILPFSGDWVLLIVNPSKENDAKVTYHVYF